MVSEVLTGERRWLMLQGDCMQALWAMPDGSVDAIVTDPPYGISYKAKRRRRLANDRRPFIWWLHEAQRITKRNAALICFCRWDVEEIFRLAIETAGFQIRSHVIWDRCYHGGGNVQSQFAPRHDVIWFATKGPFRFPEGRPADVLREPRVDYRAAQHPTEKPVDLMDQIVRAVVPEDGVVLDPCAGSGSTGLAAIRRGRRFVGIELDQEYAETAARRLFAVNPARSARLAEMGLRA